MKKFISLVLALIVLLSIPCTTFATGAPIEGEVITTFIGEDGLEYEYIKYSNPVSYAYDGTTHTLLGTIRRKTSDDGITTRDYREWTEWSIIDYGIVDSWVNMSNPYFVRSVARGEIVEEEVTKTVNLGVKTGVNIPSGSQSAVNTALKGDFSIGWTGSYSQRISIQLSGPDYPYNTRTFYYKTGYHKHDITVIEERRSNWDGLLYEKVHENCYGYEPVVRSYSEDGYA